MRRIFLAVLILSAFVSAQDPGAKGKDESKKGASAANADQLVAQLKAANEKKDADTLQGLLPSVKDFGKSAKSEKEVEPVVVQLGMAMRLFRRHEELMPKLVSAMGDLHSRKAARDLSIFAFERDPDKEATNAVNLKREALIALGKTRDPRYIRKITDEARSRVLPIAEGAILALKEYAPVKARYRKQVAEALMKRLEAEYPSTGGGGARSGGAASVSAEAEARWQKIQGPIVKALQAVCRQPTIINIENWREWWKENKKKPWRDENHGT